MHGLKAELLHLKVLLPHLGILVALHHALRADRMS